MHITIIAVGKPKEKFISDGISEYIKRFSVDFLYVKSSDKKKEAIDIQRLCEKRSNVFLLDEMGKQYTSVQFASLLKTFDSVTFVIGGADGFDSTLKKKYQLVSLSLFTMPHELALLVLVEQLYRAHMINAGRTYHRA